MKVLGASLSEVKFLVGRVSRELYEDNIFVYRGLDRCKRTENDRLLFRCTFSLGVRDSHVGKPAVMKLRNDPNSVMGRLVACWHAHHDVIEELMEFRDSIVVQTSRATYRSENFAAMSYVTAFENLGTKLYPIRAKDLCECGSAGWPFESDWYPENPSRERLTSMGSAWVV